MVVRNYPIRMNNVDVVFKKLNKAVNQALVDPDYGQVYTEKVRDEEYTIKCQYDLGSGMLRRMRRARTANFSMTGDVPDSKAHLAIATEDLKKRIADGLPVPEKDDLVISIEGNPVDFVVKEVRFQAPLRGRFALTSNKVESRLTMVELEENEESI